MKQLLYNITESNNLLYIECFGEWTNLNINRVLDKQDELIKDKPIELEISNISKLDTAGAMAILYIQKQAKAKNQSIKISSKNSKNLSLVELCKEYDIDEKIEKKETLITNFFYNIGKYLYDNYAVFISFINFLGGVVLAFIGTLYNPQKIRFKSMLYHIEHNGLYAVPIIVITSLLIGVVLTYQGSVQLQQFGANIFVVELVGISATRELAPLIAAIVIAGRTSSAYTAEIGVMKLTEEIDAMKTMGFRTWEFIVLPRIVAMMVVLPLLVIIADSVTVFGGMIIAYSDLGISYIEFIDRFRETVELKHILIGLVKAPFFGFIIALVGCFRGFLVESNTQSVGKYTTLSVVNAIFWVIAFNAVVSVILTKMGI
ncbi:MAG: ABC transporter permease [Arcobacteraceae bacterium]|jgi:phospholipid/cholesterol/gamma-HCH transport system permease protein|nr:ABC transporter permease [Arcobacteraceae bacterium]